MKYLSLTLLVFVIGFLFVNPAELNAQTDKRYSELSREQTLVLNKEKLSVKTIFKDKYETGVFHSHTYPISYAQFSNLNNVQVKNLTSGQVFTYDASYLDANNSANWGKFTKQRDVYGNWQIVWYFEIQNQTVEWEVTYEIPMAEIVIKQPSSDIFVWVTHNENNALVGEVKVKYILDKDFNLQQLIKEDRVGVNLNEEKVNFVLGEDGNSFSFALKNVEKGKIVVSGIEFPFGTFSGVSQNSRVNEEIPIKKNIEYKKIEEVVEIVNGNAMQVTTDLFVNTDATLSFFKYQILLDYTKDNLLSLKVYDVDKNKELLESKSGLNLKDLEKYQLACNTYQVEWQDCRVSWNFEPKEGTRHWRLVYTTNLPGKGNGKIEETESGGRLSWLMSGQQKNDYNIKSMITRFKLTHVLDEAKLSPAGTGVTRTVIDGGKILVFEAKNVKSGEVKQIELTWERKRISLLGMEWYEGEELKKIVLKNIKLLTGFFVGFCSVVILIIVGIKKWIDSKSKLDIIQENTPPVPPAV